MDLSSWKTRVRRWRDLPSNEQKIFLQAGVLFALLQVILRVAGFRRVYAWLAQSKRAPFLPDPSVLQATVQMVDLAAHYSPFRPNCLVRSLTLWWLLLRQGVDSDLRIGVRKQGEEFTAHAWVEERGTVLNDRADIAGHYAAFDGQLITTSLEMR
jgi:hypothetical protein